MSTPANVWFSAEGELDDGFDWYPGVFRPLRHRLDPKARALDLGGQLYRFSLCGSVVVLGDIPTSRYIEKCPECRLYP